MRFITAVSLLLITGLSACNTFNGMGQDISSAGQGLSKGATHASQKMDESKYNNTTIHSYPDSNGQQSVPPSHY